MPRVCYIVTSGWYYRCIMHNRDLCDGRVMVAKMIKQRHVSLENGLTDIGKNEKSQLIFVRSFSIFREELENTLSKR